MKSIFFALIIILMIANDLAHQAQAKDKELAIHMVALFNDKAMVSVNGGRARILKVGETLKGVTLIAANTKEATIEVNGQQEVLTLNSAVSLSSSLRAKPNASEGFVQLFADDQGFFKATGSINGKNLEFLVDTGANLVVLSSAQANRIGLEYREGERGMASTASGTAPMYVLQVREISFDSITLDSITTGVIEGDYPTISLLGMSFLKWVDMKRSGNIMTLRKRY